MAIYKRILSSGALLAILRPLTRAYSCIFHAGVRIRHDPALLALLRSGRPAIFAVWHQDFFWTCGYLSRWNHRRPTQVLASASRDGALMVAAAMAVGYRGAVRGSSARGGATALRGLARVAAAGGESLVVVCDGPRPPARVLQQGVLHVARESGLPLWLVRTSWRPALVLERSWARFVIPSPVGRGVAMADGPIYVPPDLDREGLKSLRVSLEARLNDLAERADRFVASG